MNRHEITEEFRKNVFKKISEVSESRQSSYGNAEDSFTRISILWEAYWKAKGLDVPHGPEDVAILMALFKISREMHKHSFDNILDGVNYLSFAGGFNAADDIVEEFFKVKDGSEEKL
jgi:hypothetical protein